MVTISVIIPLYNKGAYIARTLDSVSAQTFQDFEVIVVDDGSTDNGPEIVGQYKDPRLRLIYQDNAGPGAARNRGVKESSSKYVAFLDADDEWLPGFLSTSLNHLEQHSECVLCIVGFIDGRTGQTTVHNRSMSLGVWKMPLSIKPEDMKMAVDVIHSGGSVLCRREVITRFDGFYENHCTYGEDAYLWLQVLLNCKIFRDPRPLWIYHTEVSELRLGAKKKYYPPKPIFTDPEPIRRVCPSEYRNSLENYFAYYALKAAHNAATGGDLLTAQELDNNFPRMRVRLWEYTKLKIKLTFPWLIPIVRYLKFSSIQSEVTDGPDA